MTYNKIKVGDLVWRGDLMFLVVQIGRDYHDGFALCQHIGKYGKNEGKQRDAEGKYG